jgi:hypothetical protein
MAKYGKNNYFDGVVLPEPKEEALRRMAKAVKMGYNQYVDKSASTMFKSPSMPIGTNDFTLEYFGNLYGAISSNTPLIFNANAPYAYSKGCLLIYGTSQIAVRWIIFEKPSSGDLPLDSIDLIAGAQESILHLALTRKGTTVKVYINGELKATKEQSAVKDLGDFRLGMANSSNMVMSRIYNYAISAEEVAAHYNNGDPAGYVVPLADKYRWEASESNIGNIRFYPNNEGSGVTSYLEDNANGFTGRYAHIIGGSSGLLSVYSYQFMGHPVGCVVEAKFKYRSNAPVRVLADNSSLPINMEDAADATIVYRTTGTNISGFSVTVPNADANSWVEIQPVSLRTLGCIAEYLPQNLIPTAEGSVVQWLDSAPQLPEANGILPPLDASVGGYDLAAIGNPKIII